MPVRVGSLANPIDVQHAVAAVAGGGYLAVQYHSVFIMVFSGTDADARKRALAAKQDDDVDKPLSVLSSASHIFPSVDRSRIQHKIARSLLNDIDLYKRTLGAICHVRLPLVRDAIGSVIPLHMVSTSNGTPYVQMLDPLGNLVFANLVHELESAGIRGQILKAVISLKTSSSLPVLERPLSSSGVPLKQIFPRLIMIALEQTASISSKIWVDNIMHLSLDNFLISKRTSCFWLGSNPSVGSSKMRMGGL